MKIRIGDTVYDPKSVDDLSLLDLLTLERESGELGRALSMSVLSGMQRSLEAAQRDAKSPEEKIQVGNDHPDSPWLLAVVIWASRRAAGERVTFGDAISFPLSSLEYIAEVGDQPVVDPQKARPDSGRAGGRRPKLDD